MCCRIQVYVNHSSDNHEVQQILWNFPLHIQCIHHCDFLYPAHRHSQKLTLMQHRRFLTTWTLGVGGKRYCCWCFPVPWNIGKMLRFWYWKDKNYSLWTHTVIGICLWNKQDNHYYSGGICNVQVCIVHTLDYFVRNLQHKDSHRATRTQQHDGIRFVDNVRSELLQSNVGTKHEHMRGRHLCWIVHCDSLWNIRLHRVYSLQVHFRKFLHMTHPPICYDNFRTHNRR